MFGRLSSNSLGPGTKSANIAFLIPCDSVQSLPVEFQARLASQLRNNLSVIKGGDGWRIMRF